MSCPFSPQKATSFWQKFRHFFSAASSPPSPAVGENIDAEIFQSVLNTTVDAIVTIDSESRILLFNQMASKMFGYSKEEAYGQDVSIIMPEPFRSQHAQYVQNYLKTGVKRIIGIGRELTAQRKDGSLFPMAIAVSEVNVGGKRLFTGILRDLTTLKKTEAFLQTTLQTNLQMEVERKAKAEYISILAHELSSPLSAIHGSLGLLTAEEGIPEKARELLAIAYRAAEHLKALVSDVIDVEILQRKKADTKRSPVSIGAVVKESMETMRVLAQKMEVPLTQEIPEIDLSVWGDAHRLVQVMINLLTNAIKVSPPMSPVLVRVEQLGDKVRVSVCDQGAGIPEAHRQKIFTPFCQIPNTGARMGGGGGLGLHICKHIIDQLGGEIGFTTQEGKGSTFFFTLPGSGCKT